MEKLPYKLIASNQVTADLKTAKNSLTQMGATNLQSSKDKDVLAKALEKVFVQQESILTVGTRFIILDFQETISGTTRAGHSFISVMHAVNILDEDDNVLRSTVINIIPLLQTFVPTELWRWENEDYGDSLNDYVKDFQAGSAVQITASTPTADRMTQILNRKLAVKATTRLAYWSKDKPNSVLQPRIYNFTEG